MPITIGNEARSFAHLFAEPDADPIDVEDWQTLLYLFVGVEPQDAQVVPPLTPPRILVLPDSDPLHALVLATTPTKVLSWDESSHALLLVEASVRSLVLATTPMKMLSLGTTSKTLTFAVTSMKTLTMAMGEPDD